MLEAGRIRVAAEASMYVGLSPEMTENLDEIHTIVKTRSHSLR